MLENKNLYEFSDYPINHPNYDITNKKLLMKYKDKLNSKIITEFIGLQSKMNSFEYIDNYIIVNKNIHKGIKKSISLKHDEYKRALCKGELIYKELYNLQLNKQNISR